MTAAGDRPPSWIKLAREHPRVLAVGFLARFSGGVGQTFFVSLFIPFILAAHELDRTSFASLYSAATLGSALIAGYVGRGIDVFSLRSFAVVNALGLALACAGVALSPEWVTLGLSLLLLRLSGAAMMAHLATTSLSRYFVRARATALGIAFLGHPLAEACFPLLATIGIAAWGWRGVWFVAASLALVFGVVVAGLFAGRDTRPEAFRETAEVDEPAASSSGEWTRARAIRDPRIWALLPFWLAPPFLLTGFFFHQLSLASEKGWAPAWLASSFMGYAAAQVGLAFLAGPLVDRFSARRLLPFHLLPFLLGLLALSSSDAPIVAWLYMAGAGLSVGFGVTAKPTYLVLLVGARNLGGIRSLILTAAVVSTAASPPLFAALLDAGVAFRTLAAGSAAFIVVVSALAAAAMRALDRP